MLSRSLRVRSGCLVCLATILLTGPGCAVLSEDYRHITRYLDENAVPESTALKVAASPLAIPTGMVSLTVDGFLINPVLNFPKAAKDAWNCFDPEIVPYSTAEIFVFPMRIVTFVVVFLGSEIGRCCIPLDLEKSF
jgi:hypothetical protein